MSRKSARTKVFILLFEYGITGQQNQNTLDFALIDASLTEEDRAFVISYYSDICLHYEQIAQLIMQFASKYSTIDRLVSTDRAALIFGAYELVYQKKTSFKVIINEAVEFAKEYGTDKSAAFVNGVLASIAKQVRDDY